MDLLVINGTPRTAGQTRVVYMAVLEWLARSYPALRVEGFDLAEVKLPLYGYPHTEAEELALQAFADKVKAARGYVFCTPEYHHSISGALKNAIDHLEVADMAGKVAAIFTVGGRYGGSHALSAMESVCRGMRLWRTPIGCSIPLEEKSAIKSLQNPRNLERMTEVLRLLVSGLGRFQEGGAQD